jgi:hypothetical protein
MLQLPYSISYALTHLLLALPDMYMWWDPRLKENQRPATAYPWFSTHALAQTMRIGEDVYGAARRQAAAGASIVLVTNAQDPAVNNAVTHSVEVAWNRRRGGFASELVLTDLPRNHDIIDPDNPNARTDLVYPRLVEAILSTP